MLTKFFKLHAILSKRRREITAMAAVVVFITTYALTLPAISLDTTTAGMDAAAPQEPAGENSQGGVTLLKTKMYRHQRASDKKNPLKLHP